MSSDASTRRSPAAAPAGGGGGGELPFTASHQTDSPATVMSLNDSIWGVDDDNLDLALEDDLEVEVGIETDLKKAQPGRYVPGDALDTPTGPSKSNTPRAIKAPRRSQTPPRPRPRGGGGGGGAATSLNSPKSFGVMDGRITASPVPKNTTQPDDGENASPNAKPPFTSFEQIVSQQLTNSANALANLNGSQQNMQARTTNSSGRPGFARQDSVGYSPLLQSVSASDASGAPEYASPSGSGEEAATTDVVAPATPGSALRSHDVQLTPAVHGEKEEEDDDDDGVTSSRDPEHNRHASGDDDKPAARALLPRLEEEHNTTSSEQQNDDNGNAAAAKYPSPPPLPTQNDELQHDALPALTPSPYTNGKTSITFAPDVDAEAAGGGAGGGKPPRPSQNTPNAQRRSSINPSLPLSRAITDRIDALGTEMPAMQKILLWVGIALDLFSKMSLLRETYRFAYFREWNWFVMVFLFFCMSGCMTCSYWLSHYTWTPSTEKRRKSLQNTPEPVIFGYTKDDFKKIIRNIGAVFAAFQLGTAFSAFRALRTKEVKQRQIEMELRGMRFVDTLCLTLSLSLLQVYLGIKCSAPDINCPGRRGFDYILLFSVCSSLVSATLCFISLDMSDEVRRNRRKIAEIVVFFLYRLAELSSRVATLALFAATCGAYVFLFLFAHAITVLLLIRFPVYASETLQSVWAKVARTKDVTLKCFWDGKQRTFRVPATDDIKLLVICLAWPPSCYISDATDVNGQFWWRSRMAPRKGFRVLDVPSSLIPWPVYHVLMAVENGVLLLTINAYSETWTSSYLLVAVILTFVWLVCTCNMLSFNYIWKPDQWGRTPSHLEVKVLADDDLAAGGNADQGDADGDGDDAVCGGGAVDSAARHRGVSPRKPSAGSRADRMRQSDAKIALATPAKRAADEEAMTMRGHRARHDAVSSSAPHLGLSESFLSTVHENDVTIDVKDNMHVATGKE